MTGMTGFPDPELVGAIPTPLKNDGVRQWASDDIPYIMENKKCSKPPTSERKHEMP